MKKAKKSKNSRKNTALKKSALRKKAGQSGAATKSKKSAQFGSLKTLSVATAATMLTQNAAAHY